MVEKTRANAYEREVSSKHIYLRNDIKMLFKRLPRKLWNILLNVSHDLTPVNLRARRDKSHVHFLTNNSSGCQRGKQIQAKLLCNDEIFNKKVKGSKGKYFQKTAD